MTEKGFDIEMKNRKPGKYAKRMSVEEYKDFAQLQSEHEILDSAFRHNIKRSAELNKKKTDLDNWESNLESKEKAMREKIKRFTEEAEQCKEELLKIAKDYWSQPEADDPLTHYVKNMKNKNGVSIYELYQKHEEKEKERVREDFVKQRSTLDHFEEITQMYEQNGCSDQPEM